MAHESSSFVQRCSDERLARALDTTVDALRVEVYGHLCSGEFTDDEVRSPDHDITVDYSIAALTLEKFVTKRLQLDKLAAVVIVTRKPDVSTSTIDAVLRLFSPLN